MTDHLEAIIQFVQQQYSIDVDREWLTARRPEQGFSGALVLQLQTTNGEKRCLRRWPVRGLRHPRLMELHRFLRFLRRAGIDCLPVPLETRRGDSLAEFQGHLWQLEPWMPGVADFRQAPTDGRLSSIMRVLARVHCVASRYEPTAAGYEWFMTHSSRAAPAAGERIAIIDFWTTGRLERAEMTMQNQAVGQLKAAALEILEQYRRSHSRVRAELERLTQSSIPIHPCLRDVWHDHVLFMGEDVTGLIDPAATRADTVATDLSRLLGSLIGDIHDPRWARAIDIYSRYRPLSVSEQQFVNVLHVSGVLLSGMTWVERWLQGSLTEELMPRVVERMQDICRCLRSCQQV